MALLLTSSPHSHRRSTSWSLLTRRPARCSSTSSRPSSRAGRLVSKDQLVERLCEWGEEVSNNAIEVYIHRLRKKIEKGPIRIATVRGLGYCLEKIPG